MNSGVLHKNAVGLEVLPRVSRRAVPGRRAEPWHGSMCLRRGVLLWPQHAGKCSLDPPCPTASSVSPRALLWRVGSVPFPLPASGASWSPSPQGRCGGSNTATRHTHKRQVEPSEPSAGRCAGSAQRPLHCPTPPGSNCDRSWSPGLALRCARCSSHGCYVTVLPGPLPTLPACLWAPGLSGDSGPVPCVSWCCPGSAFTPVPAGNALRPGFPEGPGASHAPSHAHVPPSSLSPELWGDRPAHTRSAQPGPLGCTPKKAGTGGAQPGVHGTRLQGLHCLRLCPALRGTPMLVGAPGIPGAHYWCSPTHQPTFDGTPRQSSPKKREMPPWLKGPTLPYPPERRGHWWPQLVALWVIGTSFLDLFWGAPPGSEETVCQYVASRAPPQPYAHTCCALLPSTLQLPGKAPEVGHPSPHLHPPHLKPCNWAGARATGP